MGHGRGLGTTKLQEPKSTSTSSKLVADPNALAIHKPASHNRKKSSQLSLYASLQSDQIIERGLGQSRYLACLGRAGSLLLQRDYPHDSKEQGKWGEEVIKRIHSCQSSFDKMKSKLEGATSQQYSRRMGCKDV